MRCIRVHGQVGRHSLPVPRALSTGHAGDMRQVPALLVGPAADGQVVAERGYDDAEVRGNIGRAGSRDHVATTGQKRHPISVTPALYRQRNAIKRCFNRLTQFRRLATRLDQLARNQPSTVALAAIRRWARFGSGT